MNIKNFLLSGLDFTEDEYELKLQFIFMNSLLSVVVVMLSFLSVIRYINGQEVQAFVDLAVAIFSLIGILTARISKNSISISIPVLLSLFYFIVTFTFRNIGIIGATWYLILILIVFFLKGKKAGLFFSAISFLAILSLGIFTDAKYNLYQYIYIATPILLGTALLYLYEQRNEILNSLLKERKASLQDEISKQTKELSQLLSKSEELSSIMTNCLLEIYVIDFQTDQYLYVNDAVTDELGYPAEELLTMTFYDINTSMTHDNVSKFKKIMLHGENAMNISLHKRKDGSTYGVQSFMHRITYNKKDAYVIFDIQITAVQKAQSEVLQQKEILAYQAHYDQLTKLPNRVLLYDRLSHAIVKAKRDKTIFALLFVDLDHFKEVNDSYGHEAGDVVLVEVARRLQNCVRESDTVSRLAGDEFLIILENFESKENVAGIARLLVEVIQLPIEFQNKKLYVTCSIGISMYPADSDDSDTLIKYADRAMYNAKDNGKNNFKFYT